MSDTSLNEELMNEDESATEAQQPQGALHHVREALKVQTQAKNEAEARAAAVEAELATARRELALSKVALPDFPGKQFFLSNYSGEPTQEAIEAAAREAGFALESATAAAPAAEQQASVSAEELAAHRAVSSVAAGSGTGSDVDLAQALLNASSAAEVLAIVCQAPAEAGVRATPNFVASDMGAYYNR